MVTENMTPINNDNSSRIPVVLDKHTKNILDKIAKTQNRTTSNLCATILNLYCLSMENAMYEMIDDGTMDNENILDIFLDRVEKQYALRLKDRLDYVRAEVYQKRNSRE